MTTENSHTTAFAAADIGPREILEDYSIVEDVTSGGGLDLKLLIVCDGVGGVASGERAAYMTAHTVIDVVKRSPDTIVPRLLVEAIQEANNKVFFDTTSGKSTIAMIAIHYDGDTPYGRAYIASVGDSGIYLIRDKSLKRLNTEHNVANEMILAKQQSAENAYALPNATHLTRAIGVDENVEVDIGFYYNTMDAQQARKRGKTGFKLQQGDTIFACSDGLTDAGEDGEPYVKEDDFLRHALDNDVERTARMYLTYALRSGTHDNVSIALAFVDSKKRRAVDPTGGTQTRVLALLFVVLLAVIGVGAFVFLNLNEQDQDNNNSEQAEEIAAQSTQLAADREAATRAVLDITATAIIEQSFTPTPSATPTPSNTPSPTATLLPALGQQSAGYVFTGRGAEPVVLDLGSPVRSEDSAIYISAFAGEQQTERFSYFYFLPNAVGFFEDVNNEQIEFVLEPGGSIFVQSEGVARGAQVELTRPEDAVFYVRSACLSIEQRDLEVSIGCYAGNCEYTLERFGDRSLISPGNRLILSLNEAGEITGTSQNSIDTARAQLYDDMLREFNAPNAITDRSCAGQWVAAAADALPTPTPLPATPTPRPTGTPQDASIDQDQDGVANADDECPDANGQGAPSGCPDEDGDGVAFNADNCPDEAGSVAASGCPDEDEDGIPDELDNCPTVANPEQGDADLDGDGNACDDNDDNDEFLDSEDDCPLQAGTSTEGRVGCADSDGDGWATTVDNCPSVRNTSQSDNDNDNRGDACDRDDDNDGITDSLDACPYEPGTEATRGCPDTDEDGVRDSDDNCPDVSNPEQTDSDDDNVGDACDDTPFADEDEE